MIKTYKPLVMMVLMTIALMFALSTKIKASDIMTIDESKYSYQVESVSATVDVNVKDSCISDAIEHELTKEQAVKFCNDTLNVGDSL
jgi:ribosomal silencing factor RsfS